MTIRPQINADDIEYVYEDVSDNGGEELGVTAHVIVVPLRELITVTYVPTGKSKAYAAGHGTTFPCEFMDDWQDGCYQE